MEKSEDLQLECEARGLEKNIFKQIFVCFFCNRGAIFVVHRRAPIEGARPLLYSKVEFI